MERVEEVEFELRSGSGREGGACGGCCAEEGMRNERMNSRPTTLKIVVSSKSRRGLKDVHDAVILSATTTVALY